MTSEEDKKKNANNDKKDDDVLFGGVFVTLKILFQLILQSHLCIFNLNGIFYSYVPFYVLFRINWGCKLPFEFIFYSFIIVSCVLLAYTVLILERSFVEIMSRARDIPRPNNILGQESEDQNGNRNLYLNNLGKIIFYYGMKIRMGR